MARPGERITQKHYPNRWNWCVRVGVTKMSITILTWICPRCQAVNETIIRPDQHRSKGYAVTGRCGKCHDRSRTLLDPKDRTVLP